MALLDFFRSVPDRLAQAGAKLVVRDDQEYEEEEARRKAEEAQAKQVAEAQAAFAAEQQRLQGEETRKAGMLEQARARFDELKGLAGGNLAQAGEAIGGAFSEAGSTVRRAQDALPETPVAQAAQDIGEAVKGNYGAGDRWLEEEGPAQAIVKGEKPVASAADFSGMERAGRERLGLGAPAGATEEEASKYAPQPQGPGWDVARAAAQAPSLGGVSLADVVTGMPRAGAQYAESVDTLRGGLAEATGEGKTLQERGRGAVGAALGGLGATVGAAGTAFGAPIGARAEEMARGLGRETAGAARTLGEVGGAFVAPAGGLSEISKLSRAEDVLSTLPKLRGATPAVARLLGGAGRLAEGAQLRPGARLTDEMSRLEGALPGGEAMAGRLRTLATGAGLAVAPPAMATKRVLDAREKASQEGREPGFGEQAVAGVAGLVEGADYGTMPADVSDLLTGAARFRNPREALSGAGRAPAETPEQRRRGAIQTAVERVIEERARKAGEAPRLRTGEQPLYGETPERTPERTERAFAEAGEDTVDLETGATIPGERSLARDLGLPETEPLEELGEAAEGVQRPRKVIERELGMAAGAAKKAGVDVRTGAGADASPEASEAYSRFQALQAEKAELDAGRGERAAEATANLDAEGRDVRTGLFPGQTGQPLADVPAAPADLPFGGRGGYQAGRLESGRGMNELDSLVGDLGQPGDTGAPAALFSRLQNVVDRLPDQNDPAQLLRRLDASADVAREEVTWTGLGDLLARRASEGATVTRREMQQWLANNRIVVAEKPRGIEPGDPRLTARREALEAQLQPANDAYLQGLRDAEQRAVELLSPYEREVSQDFNAQRLDRDKWFLHYAPPVQAAADAAVNAGAGQATANVYALEVYRSKLPPNAQAELDGLHQDVAAKLERFNTLRTQLAAARRSERTAQNPLKGGKPRWAGPASSYQNYALPGHSEPGADYREFLVMLAPRTGAGGMPDQQYRTHWDEKNVIGFFRTSTRYTPDGKRVLVVEEMQSDWHQKGRKHGYAERKSPDEVKASPAYAEFLVLQQRVREADEALAAYPPEHSVEGERAYDQARTVLSEDLLRLLGERFGFDPGRPEDVFAVVRNDGQVVEVRRGDDLLPHVGQVSGAQRVAREAALFEAERRASDLERAWALEHAQAIRANRAEVQRLIEYGIPYDQALREASESHPRPSDQREWYWAEPLRRTVGRLADDDPVVRDLRQTMEFERLRWRQGRDVLATARNSARDEVEFAESRNPDVALLAKRDLLERAYQERTAWLENDVRRLLEEGQANGWLATATGPQGRPLEPVDLADASRNAEYLRFPDGDVQVSPTAFGDPLGEDIRESPQQAWLRRVMRAMVREQDYQRTMRGAENEIGRFDRELLNDMISGGKQPAGPFMEGWQTLLAKRLLQTVTKGDWDALGWTRGEIHADRYDPSQLLASASYEKYADESVGGRLHLIFDNGADRYVDLPPEKGDPVAQMGEYIGEGAARTLVEREATNRADFEQRYNVERLQPGQLPDPARMEREELGEMYVAGPTRKGLQRFYNETLPDILSKLGAPAGMRYEGLREILQYPDLPPTELVDRPTEGGQSNMVPNAEPVHFMSVTPQAKELLARQPLLFEGQGVTPETPSGTAPPQVQDELPTDLGEEPNLGAMLGLEEAGALAMAPPSVPPLGPGETDALLGAAGALAGSGSEAVEIAEEERQGREVGLGEKALRIGGMGLAGGAALGSARRLARRGPAALVDLDTGRGPGSRAAEALEPSRRPLGGISVSQMPLSDLPRRTATGAEGVRTSLGGQPLPEGEGFLDQPASRRRGGVRMDAPPAGTPARKVWDAFEEAQARADASGNPDDAWDVDLSTVPAPRGSHPTPVKDLIAQAKAGWDGRYWYEEMNDLLQKAVGPDADPRQLEELEVVFGNFGQQTFPKNNIKYALAAGLIRSELQKTPGLWEWVRDGTREGDDSRDPASSPRALVYEMMVGKGTGPVPNPKDANAPLPRFRVPGIMGMEGILDRLMAYWRTGEADIGAGTKLSNFQGDVQGARTGVGSFLSTPDRHEFARHGLEGNALEQDTAAAQYVMAMNQNLALRHPDFKGHLPRHVQAAGWLAYRKTLAGLSQSEMDKGDPAKIAADADVQRLMAQYRQAVKSGDLGVLEIPYGEGLLHDTSGKQQANMGPFKGLRTGNRSGSAVRVGQREASNAQAPRVGLGDLTPAQADALALEPVTGVPGASATETVYKVPALGRTPHEAHRVDGYDAQGNVTSSRLVVRLPATDAAGAQQAAQTLAQVTGVQTTVLVPDLDPGAPLNAVVLELPEGASPDSRAELASVLGEDVAARAVFDGTRAWWPDADDALADMIVDRAASVGLEGASMEPQSPSTSRAQPEAQQRSRGLASLPRLQGQADPLLVAGSLAGLGNLGQLPPEPATQQPAPTSNPVGLLGQRLRAKARAQKTGAERLGDEADALRAGYTPESVRRANRSARASGGAIGKDPVAYRALRSAFTPEEAGTVLDFGSGATAPHTASLRAQGYDATAHDFGASAEGGAVDPRALDYEYDTVVAANVLNVQETPEMLADTLRDIAGAVADGGRVIANYPAGSVRYMGWPASRMEAELRKHFSAVERVGGTPAVPIWRAEGPIRGADEPTLSVRESERLAEQGHFPRRGVVFGTSVSDYNRSKWDEMTLRPRFEGWYGRVVGEPALTVNDDGSIDVDLSRWQRPEQAGQPVMGGPGRGPFYGTRGGESDKSYKGGNRAYNTGGEQDAGQKTRFYHPLVVSGGNVEQSLYDVLAEVYKQRLRDAGGLLEEGVERLAKGTTHDEGRDDYNPEKADFFEQFKGIRRDISDVQYGHPNGESSYAKREPGDPRTVPDAERAATYEAVLLRAGLPPDVARAVGESAVKNSPDGYEESTAVSEAVIGHYAREAGFDAIIVANLSGYGDFKEIMDLREGAYPGPNGEFTLHPKFTNPLGEQAESGSMFYRRQLDPIPASRANAQVDRVYDEAVPNGARSQTIANLAGHDPKLVAALVLSDNGRVKARFMETLANAFAEVREYMTLAAEQAARLEPDAADLATKIRATEFAGEILSGDRVGGLNSKRPGRPDHVRIDVHALMNQIVHTERVRAGRADIIDRKPSDLTGVKASDVAVGFANRIYANLIHELVHAHVGGHGADFDLYLQAYTEALDTTGAGSQIRLRLHDHLKENSYDVVRAIVEANATLESDPYAGPWEPGRPAGADARRARQRRADTATVIARHRAFADANAPAGPERGASGRGPRSDQSAERGGRRPAADAERLPGGRDVEARPGAGGDQGDPDAGRGAWAGPGADVPAGAGRGDGRLDAATLRGGSADDLPIGEHDLADLLGLGGDRGDVESRLGISYAAGGSGAGSGAGAAAGAAGAAGGSGAGASGGSGSAGAGAPGATPPSKWGSTVAAGKLGMLFSPRGLVRQAIGQAVTVPYQPAERFLAGFAALPERGIRTLLKKDTSELPGMGEGLAMLNAYRKNILPAFREAGLSVAGKGQTAGAQTTQSAQGAPAWELLPPGAHRNVAGVIDAGYRTISFFDTFARKLTTEAELAAQGRRGVTGDAAQAKAEASADYRLLTQGLENYAQKIDELRQMGHVGETIMPFFKIPYNGMKYDLERSPLGVVSAGRGVAQRARGEIDATEMYERWARLAIGSALALGVFNWAMEDRISGDTPDDQTTKDAWRAEGRTPFSIRVGDRWVPTDLVPGLHATVVAMATAADYYKELLREGKPMNADRWSRMIGRTVLTSAYYAFDRPFFENVFQLQKAMSGTLGPREEAVPEWAAETALGYLPGVAVARDVARASNRALRAPRNPVERTLAGLPGADRFVPQARDAFGRLMERPDARPDLGPWAGAAERLLNPALGTRARPGIRRYAGSRDAAQDDAIARAKSTVDDYARNKANPAPTPREQALARMAGQENPSWGTWRATERKRLEAEKARGGGGIPVASLVTR